MAYPVAEIAAVHDGKFEGPRVTVMGTITQPTRQPDHDQNFHIRDGAGNSLLCEVIPELPLTLPKGGTRVAVAGIPRHDKAHDHWEIHPVTGIQLL